MVTVNQMKEYLETWGYQPTPLALNKILNTFMERKGTIIEKFRQHPKWDEDNMAIVLCPTEYETQYNKQAVNDFKNWVNDNIAKVYLPKAIELKDPTRRKEYLENVIDYINEAKKMRDMYKELAEMNDDISITLDEEKLEAEKAKVDEEYEEFRKYQSIQTPEGRKYITKEFAQQVAGAVRALDYMRNYCNDYVIDEGTATAINGYIDIHACAGQKVSKVVGKICREVGIDTIKDMKTRTTTDPETGETVERQYDDGYNRQYQFMADGTSPKKLKQITVISVNPMDYWGMSIGYKWSSCQTIDIENRRGLANSYQGMHSNGTMSYMLDGNTIVVYTLDMDKEGNVYYKEDKMRRELFAISDNGAVIMQARMYPDGRDGGDTGIQKQLRGKVQLITSEAWNIENKWILKKGSSECENYTETMSNVHYPDYIRYNDGTISLNKEIKERPRIKIGSKPICIKCGEENISQGKIFCEDCRNGNKRGFMLLPNPYMELNTENSTTSENETNDAVEINDEVNEDEIVTVNQCANCLSAIEREGIVIGNQRFCCEECAEEAGFRLCADDNQWHNEEELYLCVDDDQWHDEEHSYTDNYDGNYYSGDPYIETNDGNFYSSEEHAHEAGYEQDYFSDDWMQDLAWDDYEQVFFDTEDDDAIYAGDRYFATEESAHSAGYEKEFFTEEWMHTDNLMYDEYEERWFNPEDDDVIYTRDGKYYASTESASENDYHQEYYTDEWVEENELEYDGYEGYWFDPDNDNAIHTEDGNVFMTSVSAENAGYEEIDGRWLNEEERAELEEENESVAEVLEEIFDEEDDEEYEVGA